MSSPTPARAKNSSVSRGTLVRARVAPQAGFTNSYLRPIRYEAQ